MKEDIESLIKRYSTELTRLCISLCGNTADADDLFQETWFKALRRIDSYNEDYPFDKWLFSICANTFKNQRKLFYNSKRYSFLTDEEMQTFFSSLPDDTSQACEAYAELHKAIGKLPKKLRTVLVLYYFRERSISEVAEILGIPEGTVKSRLHSARNQIKRRIQNED